MYGNAPPSLARFALRANPTLSPLNPGKVGSLGSAVAHARLLSFRAWVSCSELRLKENVSNSRTRRGRGKFSSKLRDGSRRVRHTEERGRGIMKLNYESTGEFVLHVTHGGRQQENPMEKYHFCRCNPLKRLKSNLLRRYFDHRRNVLFHSQSKEINSKVPKAVC